MLDILTSDTVLFVFAMILLFIVIVSLIIDDLKQ